MDNEVFLFVYCIVCVAVVIYLFIPRGDKNDET